MTIELVCLDMAGTTVSDDGSVECAFTTAVGAAGIEAGSARHRDALAVVRETMGQAKIEVFRRILADEAAAERANAEFERAYGRLLAGGEIRALPGADGLLVELRRAGLLICLTTGFAPGTREEILDRLGWRRQVDLALSPADAGRGRPWPDMIIEARHRLGVADPAAVVVVGDTPSDMRAGVAAEAALVVGVLTGSGTAAELTGSGATGVLRSAADLPALLSARAARR